MNGFRIRTRNGPPIRFHFYNDAAPATIAAFVKALPYNETFFHARVSGQEIWTDKAPPLIIPQENATIFAEPGEVVIGPMQPTRNKIAGCLGIFYGEGRLLDCGNIFAKVVMGDEKSLIQLGNSLWRQGEQELFFELLD